MEYVKTTSNPAKDIRREDFLGSTCEAMITSGRDSGHRCRRPAKYLAFTASANVVKLCGLHRLVIDRGRGSVFVPRPPDKVLVISNETTTPWMGKITRYGKPTW